MTDSCAELVNEDALISIKINRQEGNLHLTSVNYLPSDPKIREPSAVCRRSANGMVRPCSCPVGDESWQGAPTTRSTLCPRPPKLPSPSSASISARTRSTLWATMSVVPCAAPEVVARPGGGPICKPGAVSDRHGGLRWRAPSQSQTQWPWPRCPADAGEVRPPLFEGTENSAANGHLWAYAFFPPDAECQRRECDQESPPSKGCTRLGRYHKTAND